MEKEELATGIILYKNVISDYSFLVEEIEESVSRNVVRWESATVKRYTNESINKSIRDTSLIWIPHSDSLEIDLSSPATTFKTSLAKIFYESFTPIEKDYQNYFGITATSHEAFSILKYGVGQKFSNHIDDHKDFNRKISTVYYLNDEYSGGEIEFPRFKIFYTPKPNEMLIFPSTYVYNHSVKEVTSGTRYSVVSWMSDTY